MQINELSLVAVLSWALMLSVVILYIVWHVTMRYLVLYQHLANCQWGVKYDFHASPAKSNQVCGGTVSYLSNTL